ncbi:unnamed protein product [Eruca vesicaria subsp. sativa]|uniref:DUF6821 domain-containing protein n=1 Tax=Eruca vesicaria subsp. sativa TaxID=29727 RepID=A0ABC8LR03_ERUVS|nr:unnamed protein product [Eruca vesicaria subsp. sativa]
MEAQMRSSQGDMDLDEWELLPKNCFKDLDLDHDEDDHHGAMIISPSTQDPLHKMESPPVSIVVPTKPLQVPIAWEPVLDHENKKIPDLDPDPTHTLLMDSVPSPRVSFKKMKETEFADMKIDPPARITSPVPSIDAANCEGSDDLQVKKENDDVTSEHGGEKLNLWKIGLNGIGAVCSFGVAAAAATVCVLFLGHNNIKVCKNKNQKLRFQIYSDDHKMMNEAVMNHATKVNEAIFAMKGVPVVRAQISFGGYYDEL